MQSSFRLLAVLAVSLVVFTPAIFADETCGTGDDENSVAYGAETAFLSHYLWNGVALNDTPVLQPSAWVSARGFTFTAFGNYVLSEPEELRNRFNEIALTLAYSREIGRFSLEPSFEYSMSPGQEDAPPTGIVYLRIAYPLGPVSLFTTHSLDVMEYGGSYFADLGVSFSRPVTPQLSMEVSALAGTASSKFNETYLGLSKSAFNGLEASFAVNYSLLEGLYVKPRVAVNRLMDEELRTQVNSPDITSWGITAGWEF